MKKKRKPLGYWNKENCYKVALQCRTVTELRIGFSAALQAAYKNGWATEICSHMEKKGDKYHRGLYVFEFEDKSCYIGLTYNYRIRYSVHKRKSSWYEEKLQQNIPYIFKELGKFYYKDIAGQKEKELIETYHINGWTLLNKNKGGSLGGSDTIWTKEACLQDASKYETIRDWAKNSSSAYNIALRNGWSKECHQHMKSLKMPNDYWTMEICKKDALNYKSRTEWCRKSSKAYHASKHNGWFEECCQHMGRGKTHSKKILCIETGEIFESMRKTVKKFNLSRIEHLKYYLNQNKKTPSGYRFTYVE